MNTVLDSYRMNSQANTGSLKGLGDRQNTRSQGRRSSGTQAKTDTVELSDNATILYGYMPKMMAIKSMLKTDGSEAAGSYNTNLAMDTAKEIVADARKNGIYLDFNLVYDQVRKINLINDTLQKIG